MRDRLACVRTDVVDGTELGFLQAWADEIASWEPGSHVWGHYAEQIATEAVICRTENVSACHPGVAELVAGPLAAVVADALGEPVVAFKDKINYKYPGGAGFSPHQDVVAYPGVQQVMSLLIALDECSRESGCLWLAEGVQDVLPVDERGVIDAEIVAELEFRPAELAPGDAVLIDGHAPHRSEQNRSSCRRRVLIASYVPVREGYTRDCYYAARRSRMRDATERDGRFRISTLADFEGTDVETERHADNDCTHPPAAT